MKNLCLHGPYIAIDFETSATSGACACALGMARLENFEIQASFYTLIRPPSPNIRFTSIHGLRWADLKNQPAFAELWPQIRAFCKGARFFVAHNAMFDRKVLQACCQASRLSIPKIPFLCTLLGARRILSLPSNSLAAVCAHLNIPLRHHHAGSDAQACAEIHTRLRQMGYGDEYMRLGSTSRALTPKQPARI